MKIPSPRLLIMSVVVAATLMGLSMPSAYAQDPVTDPQLELADTGDSAVVETEAEPVEEPDDPAPTVEQAEDPVVTARTTTAASSGEPIAMSLSQCSSGYFCVWSLANYTGSIQRFKATSKYSKVTLSRVGSFYNNRSKRAFVEEIANGSGAQVCYAAGAKRSSLSGWLTRAKAVYLSTATNC